MPKNTKEGAGANYLWVKTPGVDPQMTTLVTGGTGFIGSYVVNELLNRSEDVVAYHKASEVSPLFAAFINTEKKGMLDLERGDVTDLLKLKGVMAEHGVDRVIHLAVLGTFKAQRNPAAAIKVNCLGTSNVLEASRLLNVKKVVFASSIAVYGNIQVEEAAVDEDNLISPVTIYAASKLLCERLGYAYRAAYGLDFVALRFAVVYGFSYISLARAEKKVTPTFSEIVRAMIEYPLLGKPVRVARGGLQKCDFVYVKDVAKTVVEATVRERLNSWIFNVGSRSTCTLTDFAEGIKKRVPAAVIEIGKEPEPAFPFLGPLDINRARRELSYVPSSVDEGITDSLSIAKRCLALTGKHKVVSGV